MKKIAVLACGLLLAFKQPVSAEQTSCGGENLFSALQNSNPKLAKVFNEEADKVLNGKGLLWQVSKEGGKPSYVFGTMHLTDPRLLDWPQKVDKALTEASTVALELTEILNPQELATKSMGLIQYSIYEKGPNLATKMSAEDIKLVSEKLEKTAGLPWSVGQKFRPWALMGLLALPACERDRKQAGEKFLDLALGLKAKEAGKTLVGLETLESQMKVMASLPEEMMIKSLVETVLLSDKLEDIFETMSQLYLKEEVGKIWVMMQHLTAQGFQEKQQAAAYHEFQRVVVDERNILMADESVKLIDKGGAFIAVGALHLPGEKGLLSILAQRGYTIAPL